jgi:predicted Zn-dependent peptidase
LDFQSKRLPNGLEVVAESNGDAHTASVAFFVRTGARDEADDIAGVSHFLEHMCFKGTPRRSAEDVNRQFDEIGAHYNAFTSDECTAYHASVLPEYVDASVELLADIMRPSLRNDDFDTEKKVILEEIQMYLDQPPFGMDDRIKELHLGRHPLAKSVLGTSASVGGLTREQMYEYFAARYSADNVFVAAAGKIDFDRLVDQVARHCGDWQQLGAQRNAPCAESHPRFEAVTRPTATQQYVLQLADAPAAEDADRFAARLLATVVGDDTGSRMYWELTDPGLAESVSLGHYEYQGVGMFYTWLACAPELVEENLARLHQIYHQVDREGFNEDELRQAKNKVKSRIVLSSERSHNRLFHVGGNWLQRREYRTVAEELAKLDSVTADDMQAVLRRFPLSRYSTITIGPRDNVSPPA